MSHIAKIQVEIKDLKCLKKAFEHFGWQYQENSRVRTYPNDPLGNRVYEHVFKNKLSHGYDLGVNQNKESGNLDLYGDFYGGTITQGLNGSFGNLKLQYNLEVAKSFAEEEGLEYTTKVLDNGDVELTIET